LYGGAELGLQWLLTQKCIKCGHPNTYRSFAAPTCKNTIGAKAYNLPNANSVEIMTSIRHTYVDANSMFKILVQEITDLMEKILGNVAVVCIAQFYFLGRRLVSIGSCSIGSAKAILELLRASDQLGWNSFIEGRISVIWLSVVAPLLLLNCLYLLVKSWGRQFISRLHNIVHKQWIYRNTVVHYKGADGLMIPDHHKILNRIKEYSSISPDSLLPRHRYLFDTNFESLGSGPMLHRLLWLAEMDTAFAASYLASAGTLTPEAVAYSFEEHPGCWTGFTPLHKG
jgi:hypothetical protein